MPGIKYPWVVAMRVGVRTRRAALLIAAVALTTSGAHAQNGAQSQEKCTLAGTVVDAISQEPVREAAVSARSLPASEEASSTIAPTITDSSGRFSFNNLLPGRYLVFATHDGYVNQGPGRRGPRRATFDLAPGQHLDGLILYLMPGAIISGQISTAAAKPVSGVTLQALKRSHRFGKAQFDEVAKAESNELGEYQLPDLPAGDYYLRAVPRKQPKADTRGSIYVPTYYPGTTDQSRSSLLVLRAGEQLAGIDIALSRARPAVVTGRVVDAATKLPVSRCELTLVEEGNVAPVPYSASADAKGNFELKGVPRGSYTLVAEKPIQLENDKSMWGQKSVQVAEADVRNVEIAIASGVEVSGRILVDGKANVDLTLLTGVLRREQPLPLRGLTPGVEDASVNRDGSFVFHDVPEGTYRIDFFPIPAGFYLKSVRTPGALELGVTVTRGQPVQALDLALSSGVARLEGTVMKDQQPAPGTTVVLVPSSERRSQPGYYRQTVSDRQGRFALQNIIPGDYEVFAWQEVERGSYLDPDFLRQFEDQGKAVSLKDGADLNLQLEVIPSE